MREMIDELVQYRHLLLMLTWRDIKIRYKQAVMGLLWAVFMPMLIIAAGVILRAAVAIMSHRDLNYADLASVSVKSIPWSFFIGAIRFGTNSLVSNSNLITKIYFPREVFPISAVLANVFDFAISSGVLIVFLLFLPLKITLNILWLPVILLLLFLLTIAASMFFSCANLFYRDVKYIVEVILTLAIFFTPVFYEASTFGRWAHVLLLNPVAVFLESINSVVVLGVPPNFGYLSYAASFAVFGTLLSWFLFHRMEYLFAEKI
jgi:lipopolysaccharide transport system permease protein